MHPLKKFVLRNGDWTSLEKMAEAIGTDRFALGDIIKYRAIPSYPMAVAIEEYTGLQVTWREILENNGSKWLTSGVPNKMLRGNIEHQRTYILQKRKERAERMKSVGTTRFVE